jgi:hypothetical protein
MGKKLVRVGTGDPYGYDWREVEDEDIRVLIRKEVEKILKEHGLITQ